MIGFRMSGTVLPRKKRSGPVAWSAGFSVSGLELFLLGGVALIAYELGVFKPKPYTPPSGGPGYGPLPPPGTQSEKPGLDEVRQALVAYENAYKFAGGGAAALDGWRRAYRAMQQTYPEQAVFYDKPPGYDAWLAKELAPPPPPPSEPLGPGYGGGTPVSVQGFVSGPPPASGGTYSPPSGGGAVPGQPLHFL